MCGRLWNLVIFEVFGVNFSANWSIFQNCRIKRARMASRKVNFEKSIFKKNHFLAENFTRKIPKITKFRPNIGIYWGPNLSSPCDQQSPDLLNTWQPRNPFLNFRISVYENHHKKLQQSQQNCAILQIQREHINNFIARKIRQKGRNNQNLCGINWFSSLDIIRVLEKIEIGAKNSVVTSENIVSIVTTF